MALFTGLLGTACDRAPTGLDAVQADGLRSVIEAAEAAGPGSPEFILRELAWRLATAVEPTPHVPVLEELFDLALKRTTRERGQVAADRLRFEHRALTSDAWGAVAAGHADLANQGLVDARQFMAIRTAEQLGDDVATAYVAIIGLALDHVAARLDRIRPAMPSRARSMLASARNLHGDAAVALLNSDLAGAINVAAHAAGLLNALVSTL
ncbi:MAG: hypothetical protein ACREL7_14945 [Longimicrobiales bacterium]